MVFTQGYNYKNIYILVIIGGKNAMGNVSLNMDSANAETLGGIAASELDRVRAAVTAGPKSINTDGTVGVPWTALDSVYENKVVRAQVNAQERFFKIFSSEDGGASYNEIPSNWSVFANHSLIHHLPAGSDILEMASADYSSPNPVPDSGCTWVRIMNSPTCPTNYGYDPNTNDFIYCIIKIIGSMTTWITVKAFDIRGNVEFINSKVGPVESAVWSGWARTADNGNATTVNDHTVESDVPANAKFTDTTYNVATTSANGLMSSTDKSKLDGIVSGATAVGKTTSGQTYTYNDATYIGSATSEIFNNYSNYAAGSYSHAEGNETKALGEQSHAEGNSTTASGNQSHTEGYKTTAYGNTSHAEGSNSDSSGTALRDRTVTVGSTSITVVGSQSYGINSHAEGTQTLAYGYTSHAEGYQTTASAEGAHAEGYNTTASGWQSHAEGRETTASGSCAHAEGYLTTSANDSHAEGNRTTASGTQSHAEGYGTTASGKQSHAEGNNTTASGDKSHAEGFGTTASGAASHAEGDKTTAYGKASHAEGSNSGSSGTALSDRTVTIGSMSITVIGSQSHGINSHAEGTQTLAYGYTSHAEGYQTTASGSDSHAEGRNTTASGSQSHAEGNSTTAYGNKSHTEGYLTTASGNNSHAEGCGTTASSFASHAGGKNNKAMTNCKSESTTTGDAFVIGNGTSSSKLSNAFRVTYAGYVYGLSSFKSSGADYAEFIKPWFDNNPDNEDRVGYFVTIKDGLLYKANEGDYITGITSGNPSVVGNADEDYYWRYERDEFNRFVYEDVEEEVEKLDDDGNPILDENDNPVMVKTGNIIKNGRLKVSEDYDPSKQNSYVERMARPEWSYVGMIGVLPVRDDGTCEAGRFCKCGQDGIATLADERGFDTFFVVERISDNIVSVELR